MVSSFDSHMVYFGNPEPNASLGDSHRRTSQLRNICWRNPNAFLEQHGELKEQAGIQSPRTLPGMPPSNSLLVVVERHFETRSFVAAFHVEAFVRLGAIEDRLYHLRQRSCFAQWSEEEERRDAA